MFCTNCGRPRKPGANFCIKCGGQFPPAPSEPTSGPNQPPPLEPAAPFGFTPKFPDHAPLSGQPVKLPRFEDVTLTRSVAVDTGRYLPKAPETYRIPLMLVTEKSMVFLDKEGRLFSAKESFERQPKGYEPIYDRHGNEVDKRPVYPRYGMITRRSDPFGLSPFWVLDPSLNGPLDEEFTRNPKAYSKAPGVWWSPGYREWSRVCSVRYEPGSLNVDVELERVHDLAQWGVGNTCTEHREGTAQLTMRNRDHAAALAGYLSSIVKAEMPAPSTGKTAVPLKQSVSPLFVVYFYIFWMSLGALVMIGILAGLGIPVWIAAPLTLGVCILLFRFLRGRQKRAQESG